MPRRQSLAVVSLGGLRACGFEPSARLVGLRLDPCTLDVDAAQSLGGLGGGAAGVDLFGAEPAQLLGESPGPCGPRICARTERRLEAIVRHSFERRDEPGRQAFERGRDRVGCGGVRVVGNRLGNAALQVLDLRREGAATGLELEPDGLGRLACKPDLATLGVVAESLGGHGPDLRLQQLLLRDDGQVPHQLARITRQHDDAPET